MAKKQATKKKANKVRKTAPEATKPKCGLIMPISLIDGCDEEHWEEVRNILSDAVGDAGFDPDLNDSTEERKHQALK